MIGDELAWALPALRAQAASTLIDSMTSRRVTGTALDPDTDVEVPTYADGYAGRCKVTPFRQGHDTESGQVAVLKRGYEIEVDWDATPAIQRGDVVTITASADAWVVGRPLVVTEVNYSSWSTVRRFMVEDRS